jgi:uncharacterized MAPEG superfamily protein
MLQEGLPHLNSEVCNGERIKVSKGRLLALGFQVSLHDPSHGRGKGRGPMLLRMYALTAIVLTLKMAAISIAQGRARVSSSIFTNPEDAKTFGGQQAPAEAPAVERASKAWRNDLENIPIFLILAWIYVYAGLSGGAFAFYCILFMAARIAHTICYLNAIQPGRTIAFTVGAFTMLALMIHLLVRVVI